MIEFVIGCFGWFLIWQGAGPIDYFSYRALMIIAGGLILGVYRGYNAKP